MRDRSRTMRFGAAVVAAVAAAVLWPGWAGDATAQTRLGIEHGATPAPLVLESIDGGQVDLADSFGKRPVVLEFWATWCPRCEALAPQMTAAQKRFGDRVDFYGIAVAVGQDPERVRAHLAMHPLPYPMLWDGDGEATRRFMAPATSYIVILDDAGRVAYTGIDAEQDVLGAIERILRPPS